MKRKKSIRREKEGADLGMKEALKKSDVDPLEWEFFYLLRGLVRITSLSRGLSGLVRPSFLVLALVF